MTKARSLEVSKMEASGMERKLPTEEAYLVSQKQQSKTDRQVRKPTPPNTKTCRQCGLMWPHYAKLCPAKGQLQVCHNCGKQIISPKCALQKFHLNDKDNNHK